MIGATAFPNVDHTDPAKWPLSDNDPLHGYLLDLLAQRPRALCTDIDGTISEVAPTVDQATLLPGMVPLLAAAVERFDVVATISGRGVEDQRRMIGIDGVKHVGHHGYEWEEWSTEDKQSVVRLLPGTHLYLAEVAAALDEIEEELATKIPGLWMERKGITGGVHWRLASDTTMAEALARPVVRRVAKVHGLRYRGGKLAFELLPPIVTDKGQGLRRLIERHHLASVIYLGDDVSDTDAFRMLKSLRKQSKCYGLAIGVVHADSPSVLIKEADMLLAGPTQVQSFFRWLVEQQTAAFGQQE